MKKDIGMSVMFKCGKDFHCATFLGVMRPVNPTLIKYAIKEYLIEYEFTNISPKNVDEVIVAITDGEDVIEVAIDVADVWPSRECLESEDPLFDV